MRITVYSNDGSSSRQVADKLTNKLINNGFTMDAQTPEVVISVGGDGTLLSAFHRYADALDQNPLYRGSYRTPGLLYGLAGF